MYSQGHIIFIIASFIIIFLGVLFCKTKSIPTEKVIWACFLIGLTCEVIKIFCVIKMVPIVELTSENGTLIFKNTGKFSPYIESVYLPFELCSYQILFLFLARIIKNEKWKRRIYSLIYATALIGGLLAIFLSYISNDYNSTKEYLLSIRAWEFYIYHAMIVIVAIAIARDEHYKPRFSDIKLTSIIILLFDILSFYMNSLLSVPIYNNEKLMGLTYSLNYFSSYNNPLGITITTKNQYLIYLLIRLIIGFLFVVIVHLPFLKRKNTHKYIKMAENEKQCIEKSKSNMIYY